MGNSKFGTALIFIGLIGLMVSCSGMEQLDHTDPVRPLPKVLDREMIERVGNANSLFWNHGAIEIVNN